MVPFIFSVGVQPCTHLRGQIFRHLVPYESIDDDRQSKTIFFVLTWAFPMAFLSLVFYGVGLSDEVKSPGICVWRGASALKFASNMTAVALTYLGPLIVIAILNSLIVKSLRTPNPVIQGNSHISSTRLKRNRRIMAMLILIIVFFFSCYTPKFVIIVFFAFKNDAQVYQIF